MSSIGRRLQIVIGLVACAVLAMTSWLNFRASRAEVESQSTVRGGPSSCSPRCGNLCSI